MLENTIVELKTKIDKDLLLAGKMMGTLNKLIAQYNTKLTITVSSKGIFADEELHYIVTTMSSKPIKIEHIEVFGIEAQNKLDDIYAVLYQISCNQNRLHELKQIQWKQFDDTKALITELQEKHVNYVERIAWEMVKRHIVTTLEHAQDVLRHLYKSVTIRETKRVYTSSTIKIFVEIVPIITIDEECDC
nr:MAG TPA: hypothetical protein [Caudoviricetes sp.]